MDDNYYHDMTDHCSKCGVKIIKMEEDGKWESIGVKSILSRSWICISCCQKDIDAADKIIMVGFAILFFISFLLSTIALFFIFQLTGVVSVD